MSLNKTPLHSEHKSLGAKMAPFGGWDMPISYSSVLKEHEAVRTSCGIFDVSHMGEIFVEGKDALPYLQHMTINDVTKLQPGQGQYTAMCFPNGGMVDDLIIYRLEAEKFLICANAANVTKDFDWLSKNIAAFQVSITNLSQAYSQIAVQGPKSAEALVEMIDPTERSRFLALKYMEIAKLKLTSGAKVLIARTGYTGEKGFEVYLENEFAPQLWRGLLSDPNQNGVVPVGLAARDTLRLEACYLLYGNDMNDSVSPLEAGIGWATKLDKENFIGRQALTDEKHVGPARQLVAFIMEDKAIPRAEMAIYQADKCVGKVTSGSVLPTVGGAGGLALVDISVATPGNKLDIDVRGKRRLATIVKKPIYAAKVKS